MREKKKRIGVEMKPATWEALSAAAALEGRTPGELARFWIELKLGLSTEAGREPLEGGGRGAAAAPRKPSRSKARKAGRAKRDA